MLAASNETVDRLNQAAQAVRGATGELGAERTYEVRAARSVTLREGDHVLIRLNDRAQRMHEGTDVLNGYRGVVEAIESNGAVRVAWQQHGEDGYDTHRATLRPEYVAAGGLTLGCAMTGHKADGLTVSADRKQPMGRHQGGTVLVHGPGRTSRACTWRPAGTGTGCSCSPAGTSSRAPARSMSRPCRVATPSAAPGSSPRWPSRPTRGRTTPTTGRCTTTSGAARPGGRQRRATRRPDGGRCKPSRTPNRQPRPRHQLRRGR